MIHPRPAYIMGVDPGLSGAIALLDGRGALVAAVDMPVADKAVSASALRAIIDGFGVVPTEAWVEHLWARADLKHGAPVAFRLGRSFGIVEGVLGGMGIPTRLAAPVSWKRHHGLSKDKEASRALALRLWPNDAERFARKKDEARAEAALIARYGFDKRGAT